MKKYDWRNGIPDVTWFPDNMIDRQQFIALCKKADIDSNMGRIGILCAAWKEHRPGVIIVADLVADLKELAVFSLKEICEINSESAESLSNPSK